MFNPKVLKVLLVVFILQLLLSLFFTFQGCICQEPAVHFNLDSLSIKNIDHSGPSLIVTESNTMHNAAVAFLISFTDKKFHYPYHAQRSISKTYLGFSVARATSYDCDPVFLARQKVVNVSVISLYGINPAIPAGSNVTSLFVARPTPYYSGGLYLTFDEIIKRLNSNTVNRPEIQFQTFLKVPVISNQARFIFSVSFSDGTQLSDTTSLITIIPSK